MAFSQSDLDSIDTAILALATGTRVVSVTVQGRTTQYSEVSLPELRELRSQVAAALPPAAGRGLRHFVVATGKGL